MLKVTGCVKKGFSFLSLIYSQDQTNYWILSDRTLSIEVWNEDNIYSVISVRT